MHIFELFFHKYKGHFVLTLCLLLQACAHAPQSSNSQMSYPEKIAGAPPDPNTSLTEICRRCPIDVSQLLRGLLLTSPECSTEEVLEGRSILQGILASEDNSEMAPLLRKLASTRLEMLDTRQRLSRQLEETERQLQNSEKKIRELLDIESAIESKRQQNEGNQP